MQAIGDLISMTTVLMRMVLRYFICIVAIVSCHACANEKVRIDEEVVVAKAHEIRRAAGANIERYETISRRIVHRTKDELHGLSDKEIDDVLLIAPAPPVSHDQSPSFRR